MMSLSVMSPAASSRTLSLTSSVPSWSSAWVMAPASPHVRLEDDPQLLGLARLDLAVEVLEGRAAAALASRAACSFLRVSTWARAIFSSATTRRRSPASGTSDRPRMTAAVDGPAFVIALAGGPRAPGLAERVAHDDDVADPQRAVLDEQRRDGAAALVELRLDHGADGVALRVGLELLAGRRRAGWSRAARRCPVRSWPRPGRAARRRRTPR